MYFSCPYCDFLNSSLLCYVPPDLVGSRRPLGKKAIPIHPLPPNISCLTYSRRIFVPTNQIKKRRASSCIHSMASTSNAHTHTPTHPPTLMTSQSFFPVPFSQSSLWLQIHIPSAFSILS